MIPTGAAPLETDRLEAIRSAWEGMFRTFRRMDEVKVGDTEPATIFTWSGEQS